MTEIMILSVLILAAFIARSLALYGILFVVIMVTGFVLFTLFINAPTRSQQRNYAIWVQ